jgi:hypothetical protein
MAKDFRWKVLKAKRRTPGACLPGVHALDSHQDDSGPYASRFLTKLNGACNPAARQRRSTWAGSTPSSCIV